jgi:hypothetical protein
MNLPLAAILLSFFVPAMGLVLIFAGIARLAGLRPRGLGWCAGLVLCSLALVSIPLGGIPLARCLAGVVDHWSVPSIALLASVCIQQLFGIDLLQRQDRQAAVLFGTLAGLLLYPLALGWGSFDPYGLGWHFGPLFVSVGVLAVVLILRRNRFGVVLVVAIAAWHLRAVESGNYWDCLIDPFYFLFSVGTLVLWVWRACAKGSRGRTVLAAAESRSDSALPYSGQPSCGKTQQDQ